jgi:hypothetical protein
LPKSSAAPKKEGDERLRKALLSIGVDKKSAETFLKSKALDRIVVPIYWKDGLVCKEQSVALAMVPDFLRSFAKEFTDGEIRWDASYDEESPDGAKSDVAIKVCFSYSEDDDGDHWSPKPTEEELASYQKMVKASSYSGTKKVAAQSVLHPK